MMAAERPRKLRGELQYSVALSRYTTWRVGGPARCLYRPADAQDLADFLAALPSDENLLWLGLGSNLLVRDGGFDGTVILTQGALAELQVCGDRCLDVGAGVACAKVARFCARRGWTGAEFLAGIPGTMGGALAMNAGAFGGETWERVDSVTTVDRRGHLRTRTPAQYGIGYRDVRAPVADEWYVGVRLRLLQGDAEAAQARIKQLLQRRGQTQPIGQPSCGSVFRNPVGDHAARLIEAAGLKGHCCGGACVSDKHANFIVNTGAATAADIEELIRELSETVARRFGVSLQHEVRMVGQHQAWSADAEGGP